MRAIIFDIDGTLVESMAVDSKLYLGAIRQVLGPVDVRSDLREYEHVTDTGILLQVLDDNGLSSRTDLASSVQRVFLAMLAEHVEKAGAFPIIDGAMDFFAATKEAADTRIAIATGCWRESALLKLNSAGFDIDGVPLATSDETPSRIEIMRSALASAGDDVESITYFGDAEWDQKACDALGWRFVAVGPGLGGITSFAEVDL